MDMLNAVLDLFSVRIVDDLDDSASKADSASVHSRERRHRDRDRDRHRPRDRYEQLKADNKDYQKKIETLEKDLASARDEADRHRKKRKEVEAEHARLEEHNRELERRMDLMRANYDRTVEELEHVRDAPAPLRSALTGPQTLGMPWAGASNPHTNGATIETGVLQPSQGLDVSWTEPPRLRAEGHDLSPRKPGLDIGWLESSRIHTPDLSHGQNVISPPLLTEVSGDAAEMARKLAEKEQELRGLRTFLNKTDELSGQQVVDMLNDLNIELEHFAAQCVDEVFPDGASENGTVHAPVEFQESRFAEELCDSLIVPRYDHTSDPTLVQLAVQAWTLHCCARALDTFCLGIPSESGHLLWEVFRCMQRGETFSVAARWRALTHEYAKDAQAEAGRTVNHALEPLMQYAFDGLSYILCSAGCREEQAHSAATLKQSFGTKFDWILHLTTKLATSVREKIMSADFEIVTLVPNAWFDPDEMDDAAQLRASGGGGDGEVDAGAHLVVELLCTVAFGLRCLSEVKDPEGRVSHSQQRVLVRPRVVLPAMVELIRRDGAASVAGSSRRGRRSMSIAADPNALPAYEPFGVIADGEEGAAASPEPLAVNMPEIDVAPPAADPAPAGDADKAPDGEDAKGDGDDEGAAGGEGKKKNKKKGKGKNKAGA